MTSSLTIVVIFIDGANPSFIRALKDRVDEDPEYDKQICSSCNMFVIPLAFSKEHKHMLAHVKELMEYQHGYVAINPKNNKSVPSVLVLKKRG